MWPYLGKPGLTKTPLNRFSISTHFGNVRMHYRSFSMHFKTLTTFANENEMHWRSFWIHFESFAPRFKTFTTHFSEAVSHWKTFTKVQTTQQNTRTLNTSAKSMNMHCPHRAATALKKYWTLEIYFIFYICKFPRRRCSQFSFHHAKLTLGHSPFVSVPFSTLTTKITNKQLTSDMQAFKALSQINVCGPSFLSHCSHVSNKNLS